MGTLKDTKYYCDNCKEFFPVRGIVHRQLELFSKQAFCPRCDSDKYTSRYKPETNKPNRLNDKPSPAQLDYIKNLGGLPSKAKTNAEAGEMIAKLKKLKGR